MKLCQPALVICNGEIYWLYWRPGSEVSPQLGGRRHWVAAWERNAAFDRGFVWSRGRFCCSFFAMMRSELFVVGARRCVCCRQDAAVAQGCGHGDLRCADGRGRQGEGPVLHFRRLPQCQRQSRGVCTWALLRPSATRISMATPESRWARRRWAGWGALVLRALAPQLASRRVVLRIC